MVGHVRVGHVSGEWWGVSGGACEGGACEGGACGACEWWDV